MAFFLALFEIILTVVLSLSLKDMIAQEIVLTYFFITLFSKNTMTVFGITDSDPINTIRFVFDSDMFKLYFPTT